MSTRQSSEWCFGKEGENKVINEFVNNGFKYVIPKSAYSLYDVIIEGYTIEIKTRRNTMRRYDTTIIPKHKLKCNIDFFVFNFLDGIYYCDKDDVMKSDIVPIKRNDRDEIVLHYSININKLKPINKLYDIIRK